MAVQFYDPKKENGWASNFYRRAPFTVDGVYYPTSEHYFQAHKFDDRFFSELVAEQSTPGKAAFLGRQKTTGRFPWQKELIEAINEYPVTIRPDWEHVKDQVMYDALCAKFTQNEDVRHKLLETTGRLVEHTPRDSYWGDGGDGSGKNMLGKLLVRLRDNLITTDHC